MQDTMHVQPLSFQDRYASSSYAESRPRKSSTTYSSFTSTSASTYAAAEPSAGDLGVPLSRRKHHPQLHFFDEALGEEEGADASVLEDEVSRQTDREVEYEEEEEDDNKEPIMPRRRRYLTEAEYQREATDYTRQQLKQSGIYYKHAYHFWRLRSRDSADLLRQHLVKVLIALAVLIVPIVLGLYLANDGGSFGSKPDVSMLPDLAQNKFPVRPLSHHHFPIRMMKDAFDRCYAHKEGRKRGIGLILPIANPTCRAMLQRRKSNRTRAAASSTG
jgi:hypothetical protein